jgi:riboflavin kinase/FMN adenylyltransferase
MMNIGLRPTIANHDDLSLEVNLFDFEGDLYDQYITVQLLSHFRDEMKFDSIPDLMEQLNHDKETIRTYFSSLV